MRCASFSNNDMCYNWQLCCALHLATMMCATFGNYVCYIWHLWYVLHFATMSATFCNYECYIWQPHVLHWTTRSMSTNDPPVQHDHSTVLYFLEHLEQILALITSSPAQTAGQVISRAQRQHTHRRSLNKVHFIWRWFMNTMWTIIHSSNY